jgi:hypothetical protein
MSDPAKIDDPEIRRCLDVFAEALRMAKSTLNSGEADLLETCVRHGVQPPESDTAVREQFLRLHATIDSYRLSLDEGREADLMRALKDVGYVPVPEL